MSFSVGTRNMELHLINRHMDKRMCAHCNYLWTICLEYQWKYLVLSYLFTTVREPGHWTDRSRSRSSLLQHFKGNFYQLKEENDSQVMAGLDQWGYYSKRGKSGNTGTLPLYVLFCFFSVTKLQYLKKTNWVRTDFWHKSRFRGLLCTNLICENTSTSQVQCFLQISIFLHTISIWL